jgi:hypothetical protein
MSISEIKKTHVVYLSYDGLTDPLGQSQIIPYLSGLSASGYRITVISAEKKDNYAEKRSLIASILDIKGIQWIPLSYTKKPPVLSTIMDILKFTKATKNLFHSDAFQIVHCRSYITSIVGLQLKKKLGVKFIFDMRGFWADERVDGNIWKLSNPLYKMVYRYFKRKEKMFLSKADHVVSLTRSAMETINNDFQLHVPETRYSIIPCCADLNHFSLSQKNHQNITFWRGKLNIGENAFVLTYLGSLGTWYLLDEMLEFFTVLTSFHKPDALFLFITQDNPQIVKESIARHNIPESSVRIIRAGRSELPEILSVSDAAVSFIKPSFSKKASSPTKLAELLGMGIPVFSNSNVGDIEDYYQTIDSLMIPDFKPETFEKAWSQFFNHRPSTEMLVEVANHFFSLNLGVEKYVKAYKSV